MNEKTARYLNQFASLEFPGIDMKRTVRRNWCGLNHRERGRLRRRILRELRVARNSQ